MKLLTETVDFLRKEGIDSPVTGLVLGTGLGDLAHQIVADKIIDYSDIPHFPVSTVETHKGKLIYGRLNGHQVLAMQGRFHYYEGYSMQQIVFPIRVMKLLGVKQILLSNAAGGINLSFKKGSLMLITDHINLLGTNPLIGPNDESLGVRFPDMSRAYNPEMLQRMLTSAKAEQINLHQGVYAAVSGPNLETAAEYRYLRTIGADLVGMSTVPEVIACNHMQLPCAAVSVITDECDPDNLKPVELAEIIATAAIAEKSLTRLFMNFLKHIPK
ncbi:MAG: purine-nucleoside phosphorylase [Lentimicrobiaceae bacterium]|nr:purine-nucleoside phosphorylase [Lentimicrobiaceae bacterium]MCB9023543.1 purine-nucleoside phosphorylase [Lentimicrobiaceae bacterium]MCO5265996.1 purine-nucleoside phosphorylase [Lentimicrobium sp.]